MNHGSLFSGIGGFDLAAEWMGWNNIFNCEWEEFPRKVLKHHFPNAEQHEDIREFDATTYAGRIDILSGGFPCQPYSVAGLRKGKEDERHLWPQMLRIIRECQPRWVVGENVRGLVNWSEGLVFEEVCADLEACGYSVQPFILPACAVNAPHRRDRVWFVAKNTDYDGRGSIKRKEKPNIRRFRHVSAGDNERIRANYDEARDASNTQRIRLEHTEKPRSMEERKGKTRFDVTESIEANSKCGNAPDTDSARTRQNNDWENFPTVPPVCGGDDGLPEELDGITFSKWRRESIKAYGNAIVPQVALRIFESIQDYEKRTKSPPPR